MSIRLAYNKYTDTNYAYEVTYEWDEAKQKKVQRQKCIGHVDPETGEIVPNGKRGRPRETSTKPRQPHYDQQDQTEEPAQSQDAASAPVPASIRYYRDDDLKQLTEHVEHIDTILTQLSKGLQYLGKEMARIDSVSKRRRRTGTLPSAEEEPLPESSTPEDGTSPGE